MIEFYFKDVEKIFHAGDFIDWSIADYLSSQKELIAVCGNMDSRDIWKAFPEKRTVEIKGFLSRAEVLLPIPEVFITQPPRLPFSTTFVSPVTICTEASRQVCFMLFRILSKSERCMRTVG
jgi:hypothetical protein